MGRRDDEEVSYRPGDELAGKYRVERVLGVGGMGAVLAARHLVLEERVAIKVLLPSAARTQGAAERFLREGRAAVRIKSEHVARVTDVGTLPDGAPFMVMEYLDGHDLSAIVKARGPQPIHEVIEWVLQACEAIAEAHALGIVHRDLKPANLFLVRRVDGSPCIKVLDFGISKVVVEGDKGMTKTSDVMGSPYYMSPEQMRSTRDVDARADVWALGAILFELLSGVPPFDAETMTGLVVAITQESPRELARYRSDVPRELVQVVLRCLAKPVAERFQDVGALAVALAPFGPARAQAHVERILAFVGRPAGAITGPGITGGPGSAPHAASPASGWGAAGAPPAHASVPPSAGAAGVPAAGPPPPAGAMAAQTGPGASWGGTSSRSSSQTPKVVGAIAALVALAGIATFVGMKGQLGSIHPTVSVKLDLPSASVGVADPPAVAPAAPSVSPSASADAQAAASASAGPLLALPTPPAPPTPPSAPTPPALPAPPTSPAGPLPRLPVRGAPAAKPSAAPTAAPAPATDLFNTAK